MNEERWRRMRRAAWLAFAAHLMAGLAMALILRHGLETNTDLMSRLAFVARHQILWSAAWFSWTIAAATILNFFVRFAGFHRPRGVSGLLLKTAVLATVAAIAADWTAQALEVIVLPGFARTVNLEGFLVWHRRAVILTGFLANALYTLSTLLLVWGSRHAYPRWIRVAGLGVVAGGLFLSVAAWADSAVGMVCANLVLIPSLLAWLAGLAVTPPTDRHH